jgi:hypothetical protein
VYLPESTDPATRVCDMKVSCSRSFLFCGEATIVRQLLAESLLTVVAAAAGALAACDVGNAALLACADPFQTPLRDPTPAEAATKGFQRCRNERASRSSALPDVWERRVRGCVADTRLLVRMSGCLDALRPSRGETATKAFRRCRSE